MTCTFLFATPTHSAADSQGDQLAGADSLFAQGRYFEASIAYERVYFRPASARQQVRANLGKAAAMKQMGDFAGAGRDLQRSLAYRADDSLRQEVLYELAFCAYMSGGLARTQSFLMQYRHGLEGGIPGSRIFLLEGLVMAEQGEWEALRLHLEQWSSHSDSGPRMQNELLGRYDELLISHGAGEKPKDARKARRWSTFVPGAGQIYAGEPGWGALNAFSQLAALGGAVLLGWHSYYIAGGVLGLGTFQSLYFGGIRHAAELAEAYNNSHQERIRAAVGTFLIRVAPDLSTT